jgi:nucleoid-associated protein YgaU
MPAVHADTLKGVFALLVVLCAMVAVGLKLWRGNVAAATSAAVRPVVLPVTVRAGDSLWSLARRYGDPSVYILDRVDTLARTNKLTGSVRLTPGQRLLVPVGNPAVAATLRQARGGMTAQ